MRKHRFDLGAACEKYATRIEAEPEVVSEIQKAFPGVNTGKELSPAKLRALLMYMKSKGRSGRIRLLCQGQETGTYTFQKRDTPRSVAAGFVRKLHAVMVGAGTPKSAWELPDADRRWRFNACTDLVTAMQKAPNVRALVDAGQVWNVRQMLEGRLKGGRGVQHFCNYTASKKLLQKLDAELHRRRKG